MAKHDEGLAARVDRKMREEVAQAMQAAESIGIPGATLSECAIAPVVAAAAAEFAPGSKAAASAQALADTLRQAAPARIPDLALFALSMCACAGSDRLYAAGEDIEGRFSLAAFGSGAFFGIMTAAGDPQLAKLFLSRAASANASAAPEGSVKAAKRAAMQDIYAEFARWQRHEVSYANDAAFAKAMQPLHADVIRNEGSIKNKCTRWRRESSS